MFAALSEMPDFFRPKMKAFIALAPALRIINFTAPRINQMKSDEKARMAFEMMGPELFWRAAAADFVSGAVANSSAG